MEVNIGEIKDKKGGEIQFHLVEDWSHMRCDGQSLHCISPVIFDGKITCTGELFLVRGNVSTTIEANCSRCLRPIELEIKAQLDERFQKASHAREQEPIRDEQTDEEDWGREDIQEFRGLTIHLDDVVLENLLVCLPIKPLCEEDCRGLCSQCGQDLNDGECDCITDDIDPRMLQLRKLLDSSD
ncbi:MAG: DUF177 domain-containing protein [Firmicutes bacterium]|nr:DUF177 domain-containing protein [Bacillota bacterium]